MKRMRGDSWSILLVICVLCMTISGCVQNTHQSSDSEIRISPSPSIPVTQISPKPSGFSPHETLSPSNSVVNPGTYVFIVHHVSTACRLVNGTPFFINFNSSCRRNYVFDQANGTLKLWSYFPNEFESPASLKVVYAECMSYGGDCGEGTRCMVSGGDSLYFLTPTEGLVVYGLAADGTARIHHRNETLYLKPGEQWTNISIVNKTTDFATIEKVITDSITNYGALNTSNITMGSPPPGCGGGGGAD